MTKILVDTSIWIDFFSSNPKSSPQSLGYLAEQIADGAVVIIQPIRAELFSGQITKRYKLEVARYFDALELIDPDWKSKAIWDRIVDFANLARDKGLAIPGLVDRMILLCAQEASASLYTADKALNKLARTAGVPLWHI